MLNANVYITKLNSDAHSCSQLEHTEFYAQDAKRHDMHNICFPTTKTKIQFSRLHRFCFVPSFRTFFMADVYSDISFYCDRTAVRAEKMKRKNKRERETEEGEEQKIKTKFDSKSVAQ